MGLLLILPIVAFDIWLTSTTGVRQLRRWKELKEWRKILGAVAVGIALAVWVTFFLQYGNGPSLRVKGFPVPLVFFHLEGKVWARNVLPADWPYLGAATDFLTGLVAPFIPFKVAEFLKTVKEELK